MDTQEQSITDGDSILPLLGNILTGLAIAVSILWSIDKIPVDKKMFRHVTFVAQIFPLMLLIGAFIVDADSLDLVSRFGGDDLPLLYRISAVWGGRAGPLLLWAALLGVIGWFMFDNTESNLLQVRLMHSTTAVVLVISWLLQPFAESTGAVGILHPLLQTNLMVIHPPIVFSFYSLCIAVACVSLAGLIEGRDAASVHKAQLHWARAGFLVGVIGIGLGGLWAYTVLDWGGYWAWDPVETASILPWLALLMIVHARARTDSRSSGAITASPAIGMLSGALAIHATLVTRANGVWASVHSFVGNEDGQASSDPYIRILELFGEGAIGLEVLSYTILILIFSIAAVWWMACQQKQAMVSAGQTSMLENNFTLAAALLAGSVAIGIWIESTSVTLVGFSLMLLLVRGNTEKPPAQWVFGGVFLMLFASWTWTATLIQAVAGMLLFLTPWLLSSDEEEISIMAMFSDTRVRTKIARTIPWYGAAAFLGLTWLLLTAEIDGTSLAAHEFYGAPIIAIGILALTLYSWGKRVNFRNGNILMILTLLTSLALAFNADKFSIPGDPNLMLTSNISRGALSLFLLSWLFFALPPAIQATYSTLKRIAPAIKANGITARTNGARLRLFGSHLAHLGIILLLMGHVMTTTLVDRSDPEHLITLEKDVPVEFNGYGLTFTETVLIEEEDSEYPYNVGEGFAGFTVEIRDDGELVDEVTPGIIRFDFNRQRSEVDRMVRPSGDMIFILDSNQAAVNLGAMMSGDIDEITEIRVTVHDLKGSHLVWAGWAFIMLGGFSTLLTSQRNSSEAED